MAEAGGKAVQGEGRIGALQVIPAIHTQGDALLQQVFAEVIAIGVIRPAGVIEPGGHGHLRARDEALRQRLALGQVEAPVGVTGAFPVQGDVAELGLDLALVTIADFPGDNAGDGIAALLRQGGVVGALPQYAAQGAHGHEHGSAPEPVAGQHCCARSAKERRPAEDRAVRRPSDQDAGNKRRRRHGQRPGQQPLLPLVHSW